MEGAFRRRTIRVCSAILSGLLLLFLAGCLPFFPSDPLGGLAATRVNGAPAVALPECSKPLLVTSVSVRTKAGGQLWSLTATEPQPQQDRYILGKPVPGYQEKGTFGDEYLNVDLVIQAVYEDGVVVISDANFAKIPDDGLYIAGKLSTREQLNAEVGC